MQENLFYTVPPGALEAYRKAIDSHFLHFEVRTCQQVCYTCYNEFICRSYVGIAYSLGGQLDIK